MTKQQFKTKQIKESFEKASEAFKELRTSLNKLKKQSYINKPKSKYHK